MLGGEIATHKIELQNSIVFDVELYLIIPSLVDEHATPVVPGLISPATSKVAPGEVVPMPTPVELMRKRSAPDVPIPTTPAPGRKMPVAVSVDQLKLGEATLSEEGLIN
jgi:hypothetical protein